MFIFFIILFWLGFAFFMIAPNYIQAKIELNEYPKQYQKFVKVAKIIRILVIIILIAIIIYGVQMMYNALG